MGQWWYLPLLAAAGLAVLIGWRWSSPWISRCPPAGGRPERKKSAGQIPALFWVFVGALVIYGVGETMFGNWGTTLLVGKGVSATSANNGLAVFWAAVTVGRLAIALVSTRVRSPISTWSCPGLSPPPCCCFPRRTAPAAGIALFAFGGLACSGFFPMTIGYGESTFPNIVELVAGWLIAAYQVGYGLAAFGGGALQRHLPLHRIPHRRGRGLVWDFSRW